MESNSTDEIVSFFKEVQRVISKYGLEKVLEQLRKIHLTNDDDYEKEVYNHILTITSNKYNLEKDVVLFSNKRGIVTEARRMCFALMKEHLAFSDEEIGTYFGGKTRQFINRELKSLPLNQDKFLTKYERKFYQDFVELTTDVLHFKNKFKRN